MTKKSFVIYQDQEEVINKLSDEQAGILYKAIFEYNRTRETPELDMILDLVFTPIKSTLDRDYEKWLKTCDARKEAGRKGGYQKVANLANASKCYQDLANVADSENDSESEKRIAKKDSEKEKEKENEKLFNEFYALYPLKKSKIAAQASFNKVMKDNKLEDILTGLEKYNRSIQDGKTEKQYIKHPSTWLNQGCWQDEYKEIQTKQEPEISYEL